jgi:DNA recombination protein RmuC
MDLQAFASGIVLGALVAAAIGWLLVRSARQHGELAGRLAREGELALLKADRDRLADAVEQQRHTQERQLAALEASRAQVQRLDAERAAFAARAERVRVLEDELATLRGAAEAAAGRVADLTARAERVDALERELAAARNAAEAASSRSADLTARIEEQQRANADRLRDLEQARERMKAEFQALAADILEDKARRLSERSNEQLGQLLNPLREQLGDFRKSVNDAYEKESGARIALQTEVRQLLELNRKLGDEANSLTRALTADSRSQGYWGELKLERLLELAGLRRGHEYLTQESFRDGDGDLYRPDAVLKLPGGRDIVIDAKVALTDYQRACAQCEAEERDGHLSAHCAALRRHVLQLGTKDYSRLDGINAPDMVFMFIPVEGAFLEALQRDAALYDDAFKRKIILVGPSNLLASLRLVAQIWRTEDQNRNAQQIAEKAGGLYDKLAGFVEDLGKVGDALDRAQKMHQSAMGKLAQGRGNLLRRAESLRSLGVSPGKQLPSGLLALSDPDDDTGLGSTDDAAAPAPTP